MFTKKSVGLIFGVLFLFAFLAFVVSAQSLGGAVEGAKKVFDLTQDQKEIFTKILMFVLLFMIIYQVVGQIFDNKMLSPVISVIVSILAVWWLPVDFVNVIRNTYGAMGAAILSVIPFLIVLVFTVRLKSLLGARLLWIFFVIYYFGMTFYEMSKVGSLFKPSVIPYLGAVAAGVIIFFVLPQIRNLIFKGELEEMENSGIAIAEKAKLLSKIEDVQLRARTGKNT